MSRLNEVVILSGGKSKRFGSDKALARINNKRFIDVLYDNLSECYDVKISTQGKIYKDNVRHIYDEKIDIGPIEGIRQALISAKEEFIGIVSVDTPYVSAEMFKYLEEFISSDFDIYVFRSGNKVHPLCGIYNKNILDKIEKSIEDNQLSITKLIAKLRTKYVDIKYSRFEDIQLKNFNYLSDIVEKKSRILAISGVKNSGKTSLICKLIPILSKKVDKLAVIKHDGHNYDIDYQNTDTYKYMQAGARNIGIFSDKKMTILQYRGSDPENVLSYFKDFELIILEGCKNTDYPKIEICRQGNSDITVCSKNVYAVATDIHNFETNYTKLDLNNVEEIADFIIANILLI